MEKIKKLLNEKCSIFKGDLFGGIIASIIAFPQALAFGVASGMGAPAGIWGAIILSLTSGILSGRFPFVSGPTGPTAIVILCNCFILQREYPCCCYGTFNGGCFPDNNFVYSRAKNDKICSIPRNFRIFDGYRTYYYNLAVCAAAWRSCAILHNQRNYKIPECSCKFEYSQAAFSAA